MLIGLPVDGKTITGVSEWYYNNLCLQPLGKNSREVGGNKKKS
jgi:hypothetical protein